jgi:hypothetical protein
MTHIFVHLIASNLEEGVDIVGIADLVGAVYQSLVLFGHENASKIKVCSGSQGMQTRECDQGLPNEVS